MKQMILFLFLTISFLACGTSNQDGSVDPNSSGISDSQSDSDPYSASGDISDDTIENEKEDIIVGTVPASGCGGADNPCWGDNQEIPPEDQWCETGYRLCGPEVPADLL